MKKVNKLSMKIGLIAATTLMANLAGAATYKASEVYAVEKPVVQSVREAVNTDETAIEGLELLNKIGKYEQELMVYTTAKPTASDLDRLVETSAKLADGTGIRFSKEPGRLGENRIGYRSEKDPSASFEIDPTTGNFLFNSGMQKYRDEVATKNLPQEAELERLAYKAAEQFGLNTNFEELQVEHIGGLNMGVTDGSGGTVILEKLKTVRFNRVLGDIPVSGDSRLVMHFGENAELSGLVYQLPTIEKAQPLSSKMLQDPEVMKKEALEELTSMAKKAKNSRLTAVDLVLYDDGQGVLEPAYHIVLNRYIDDGSRELVMIPYDFYVSVNSEPMAFYPSMEIAAVEPKDGQFEGKVDTATDE